MQLLATADQMQGFDRLAINTYGIPGVTLMENAGRAFVDELDRRVGPLSAKDVVVVCGKGNNGGDGYVIARHIANRGSRVHIIALCKQREVKGDAKINVDIFRAMVAARKSDITYREVSEHQRFPRLKKPDIVVDAIFGTGFTGSVHGVAQQAIAWINAQRCFVAAVDVPSGINATTGMVENVAVRADLTVSMGLAKVGHFIGAGREHSGEVVVADISIPQFVFTASRAQAFRVLAPDVARVLPRRPLTAHKHSVGKIFVLAGSRNLTGAPAMSAQSAMMIGAGAVILGVPKSIYSVLARKVTEVMVTPLAETPDGTVAITAMEEIRKRVDWADVVVVGPGLSTHPETVQLVLSLLPTIDKPVVVDADGLNAIASKPSAVRQRKSPTILTPHAGELSRIMKQDSRTIELKRVDLAAKAAKWLKSTLVLKGSPTVAGTPTGHSYVNSTGNPGMATAGAGDVLTGIVAGLVGQGMIADEAAYAGVWIHGMAGDLAANRYGQRSIMALDILDRIPDVLKSVELA